MKLKTFLSVLSLVALGIASPTRASIVFDLEYTDPSGNVANGLLTADDNGNGTYTATSGFLNVTLSSNPNVVGSYSLLPGSGLSPSGAFIYDNLLTYPGDPYLSTLGLLGFSGGPGIELNLWGNAPGNYSLYAWGNQDQSYILAYDGSATTSITPVPEPTTALAATILFLPFGARAVRSLRKNRMA